MEILPIVERWSAVLDEIADAAIRAGRSSEEVRLLAVSKFHSAEDIAALHGAGQRLFGENYVQEALGKMSVLPADVCWHFIGHPQTNKVRSLVGAFAVIQGIDSVRLAQTIDSHARAAGLVQDVFVQVNLAGEIQKSGVSLDDLPAVAEFLAGAVHVRWRGLMLMPPVFDDPEGARPFFCALRELRDRLEREYGVRLPELSMGMTGDFCAAIAEGSTLVRIGTKIFGARRV